MDNQEAIASLKTLCHTCDLFPKCVNEKPECFEAIELAISALQAQEAKNSNESSLTQKGLDTISRQAAKEAYCKKFCHPGVLCPDSGFCREVDEAFDPVPSAQPERKNGRWEMKPDPFGIFGEIPICSECGCTTKMRDKTKFCPHCGAQMEGQ